MKNQLVNRLRRPYLSRNEEHDLAWLKNLYQQLPPLAGRFEIERKVAEFVQAYEVYTRVMEYQRNARSLMAERTVNKAMCGWSPRGGDGVTVMINLAPVNPVREEHVTAGVFTLAIELCDAILASGNERCSPAVRELLRLNHVTRRRPSIYPRFEAEIVNDRLRVSIVKGDFQYFTIRVDHGTGRFDREFATVTSPFYDRTPLPEKAPQIWRVQVVGYRKDNDTGVPGYIIDVAAKQSVDGHVNQPD